LGDDLGEFLADDVDRRGVVDIEKYAADKLAAGSGPVLKRFLDEVAQRNDHPPRTPQPDYDVTERDVFDIAGFILHDDGIIDPDRLRHGELDAGEEIAQHRPGREPGDDAGDAGRGEQSDAVLAHGVKRHQGQADGDEHDHHVQYALENPDLSNVFAREQIVLDVRPKLQKVYVGRNVQYRQRYPPEQADGREPEKAGEYFGGAGGERRRGQGDGQCNQQQSEPCRSFRRLESRSQEGPLLADRVSYKCQSGGMQQQRHDRGSGEKSGRQRPIRCGR
jgi:hypothetical protein